MCGHDLGSNWHSYNEQCVNMTPLQLLDKMLDFFSINGFAYVITIAFLSLMSSDMSLMLLMSSITAINGINNVVNVRRYKKQCYSFFRTTFTTFTISQMAHLLILYLKSV